MNAKSIVGSLTVAMILVITGASNAHANPNSTTGTLSSIGSGWGGEGIYLTITPALSACSGRVFMATSAIQYKENLALAMFAMAQSLPITIYYSATCDASGDLDFVSMVIS